jgi:hypothetical protein
MGKNWSKGTVPLVSQPANTTLPASSREGLFSLLLQKGPDNEASRSFLLRVVQPGLSGLMDGSVSTLAPIFATAFATHRPFTAFLVGLASTTGAGISMAFSEALSDDGELTGRGSPIVRGGITGGMTFLGGSLHTLPFLVPNLQLALVVAYIVVSTTAQICRQTWTLVVFPALDQSSVPAFLPVSSTLSIQESLLRRTRLERRP